MSYIRKATYSIEEVLPFIGNPPIKYGNVGMQMSSKRLRTFKEHGIKCSCGLEGKFFAQERHKKQSTKKFHFNLYALDDKGQEVLMTRDHVIPLSRGGLDTVENSQTLCANCNSKKSDCLPGEPHVMKNRIHPGCVKYTRGKVHATIQAFSERRSVSMKMSSLKVHTDMLLDEVEEEVKEYLVKFEALMNQAQEELQSILAGEGGIYDPTKRS